MPGRSTLLILGLAAAVGIPYLSSSSGGLRQWLNKPSAKSADSSDSGWFSASSETSGQDPAESKPPHPEGPPVTDLGEVFRFDIPPGWVLARWPRVNTRLASLDLHGYRVALVTGTKESDLAGSLTYYFGPDQHVQRITFIGKSGDPSPLVAFLTSRYRFKRKIVDDPSLALYQVKRGWKTLSEMRIRPASSITADDPYGRFEVSLVIERP